ncbi:MAG: DoxX family protein [Gemmatimonadota bacterium]|nr:DoxX family protein [Gemmatimonadota bacterium]
MVLDPTLLSGLALFLLRLALALLFGSSGWSHLSKPRERAESVGLPVAATALLGAIELGAAVLLVLGLWVRWAALLLIGVMLGAIYKKVFVWKTGFWGDESQGWFYEVLYLICNLVLLSIGGGAWVLFG